MTILISAVIVALSAQTALAEQRANKPFTTVNGRTAAAAPAAPRIFTVTTPGGGASANAPAPTAAPAMAYVGMGGGRQVSSRSSSGRAVHRGGKSFWGGGRRVDGGGPSTTPAPAPGAEELPPHFTKPGALIRTTGQLPKYEIPPEPGTNKPAAGTHTTNAGEIVLNDRKGFDVGRAPSVHHGPKDTPPPPNPVTNGTLYTSGATANSGPTSGGSGHSGGNGGGHDNNGSGNNGKDKPGDDDDGHGGDRARESSFNDAF
jgi:hypothetical protein